MTKFGYIRVSTEDQKTDRQFDQLRRDCDELFVEHASAASRKRPVYETMVKRLQPGDSLVVTSVDRAFRSTVDAITEAEKFIAQGIHFQVLNLNVDTSTADGLLAYSIVAAVATHERMRISERTKEGMASARLRGKVPGPKPKLSPAQLAAIRSSLNKPGVTIKQMASENGMSPWGLSRALNRLDQAASPFEAL